MIRPTKEDIKGGLASFLGQEFCDSDIDDQEEIIEIFHSIIHDDKHPIPITKSTTLEKDIKQAVSAFVGRRDKMLTNVLHGVIYSILHPEYRFVHEAYSINKCAFCKPLHTRSHKAAMLEAKSYGRDDEDIKKWGTAGTYMNPLICEYQYVRIEDEFYKRVVEDPLTEPDLPTHCHDCGVCFGEIHHATCDVERCAKCGDDTQFISCDHSMGAKYYVFGNDNENIKQVCVTCQESKRLEEFDCVRNYELSDDVISSILPKVKAYRRKAPPSGRLDLDLQMSKDILASTFKNLEGYQLSWLYNVLKDDRAVIAKAAQDARADECVDCCELKKYR